MFSKKKSLLYLLAFLLHVKSSYGENVCPDWLMKRDSRIPTCPDGGLVPENFPVAAVVVSDVGRLGHDSEFAADVVERVLKASGDNNPMIILPVSGETMQIIRARIENMQIGRRLKNRYLQSLFHLPTSGFTWQRDYFRSFINPSNGQVVLRQVQGYAYRNRTQSSFDRLIELTQACGFQRGPELTTPQGMAISGHGGGNIETLPGGICLLGDDHFATRDRWEAYADQICNSGSENRIKVPTSWLRVGHTDEIIKVVRNKNAQAPCDFSVVLASPRKAIELLRRSPERRFLNFLNSKGGSSSESTLLRIASSRGLFRLCRKFIEEKNRQPRERPHIDRSRPTRGVGKLFDLINLFRSEAYARQFLGSRNVNASSVEEEDCVNMKNIDVYQVLMGDKELSTFNDLVQDQMDSLREEVEQKLRAKLPQCRPDFIEVPNIFYGGTPVERVGGGYALPNQMGVSLLPNSVNAISINDTVISPYPFNDVFQDDIINEYKKRGLRADFVDTFYYAHIGGGDLHCVTNTIHICNPRGR